MKPVFVTAFLALCASAQNFAQKRADEDGQGTLKTIATTVSATSSYATSKTSSKVTSKIPSTITGKTTSRTASKITSKTTSKATSKTSSKSSSTKTKSITTTTTSSTSTVPPSPTPDATGLIRISHSTPNKTLRGWYLYAPGPDQVNGDEGGESVYFVQHAADASQWRLSTLDEYETVLAAMVPGKDNTGRPYWVPGMSFADQPDNIQKDVTYMNFFDFWIQGGEPWVEWSWTTDNGTGWQQGKNNGVTLFAEDGAGRHTSMACWLGDSYPRLVVGEGPLGNSTGNNCSEVTLVIKPLH